MRRSLASQPSPAARKQSLNDDLAEIMKRRRSNAPATPQRHQSQQAALTSSRRVSGRGQPFNQKDFDDWLKLIRTNKLNSESTWSAPIIDYFASLDMLKENGGQVNFSRASLTLDGAVRLYTNRVDSASVDVHQLLNGITDTHEEPDSSQQRPSSVNNNVDGDAASSSELEGEEEVSRPRRKHRNNKKPDCLLDVAKLSIDVDELKGSIDPLLRHMCAHFDEGGAQGLLMSSLKPDNSGRFSLELDATGDTGTEAGNDVDPAVTPPPSDSHVDLVQLKLQCFGENLDHLSAIPSLDLVRQRIENPTSQATNEGMFHDDIGINNNEAHVAQGMEEELTPPDEDGLEEIDQYGAAIDAVDDVEDLAIDEAPQDNAINMSLASIGASGGAWIDTALMHEMRGARDWAGPEHWKIRRLRAREPPMSSSHDVGYEAAQQRAKHRRRQREQPIDFSVPPTVTLDELFEPPKRKPLLTQAQLNIPAEQFELPENLRFSAPQLFSLTTKPDAGIADEFRRLIARRGPLHSLANHDPEEAGNTSAGSAFWETVQLAAEEAGPEPDEVLAPFDEEPLPRTRQFVGGEPLAFARFARRVDVKQLKDDLWHVLEAAPSQQEQHLSTVEAAASTHFTDAQRTQVTRPFVFISLLHLANEHDLELEGNAEHNDLLIRPLSS